MSRFDALLLDPKNQFDLQGPLEEMLVEKIAVAYWRLRRAHRYEVGLIRQKLDHATDEYDRPIPNPDPFSKRKPNTRDDEIDAEISRAQKQRLEWQDDRDHFARPRDEVSYLRRRTMGGARDYRCVACAGMSFLSLRQVQASISALGRGFIDHF